MTESHPITPPPHLVQQWTNSAHREFGIATSAARWGADTELEACVQWVKDNCYSISVTDHLRAARRPKPPSLKDEARQIIDCLIEGDCLNDDDAVTLRRVLEALPE